MAENEKKDKPKDKLKPAFKLDEKSKKILIVFLAFLILAFLLFYFKQLFVAAVVNNKPITRFTLDRELEKQGGQQVLESLVTKSLILQEAKNQGVIITQKEIDEKISEIEKQVESQGSDLDTLLLTQGQTRKSLEEQIKIELIIGEILNDEITISDEEVQEYYEENKEYYGEEANFEEIKESIREELRQTKLSERFQLWLEEVKQKAKIYYFLKF